MTSDGPDRVVNEYGKFTMIPNEIVLADPADLSDRAKVLYMHLVQLANDGGTMRSRDFLAKRIGKSVATVDRGLRELVAFSALKIIANTRTDGSPDWNEYRLIIIRRPKKPTRGVSSDLMTPPRKSDEGGVIKSAAIEEDLAYSKNPPTPQGVGVTAAPEQHHELFEAFWREYPKHEDRDGALSAWFVVARRGVTASHVIVAARDFAAHHRREGTSDRFIPKPARWLRDGSYDNPIPTAQAPVRRLHPLLAQHDSQEIS